MATHAWTKLYTETMSWISGVYECRSCLALTDLIPSHDDHIKFVLPVSSLPLMIRSGTNQRYVVSVLQLQWSPLWVTVAVQPSAWAYLKFKVYGHKR